MIFSKLFKLIWWISVLVIVGLLIVFIRWDSITSENISSFDLGLLASFLILLLLPFYSEISLFGMNLKQKIDEGNEEIKHFVRDQIFTIRTDFQNAISVNNQLDTHVDFSYSIPDDSLDSLANKIVTTLDKQNISSKDKQLLNIDLDENTLIAFKSRYLLEKELRRIWSEFSPNPPRVGLGIVPMASNLQRFGLFPEELLYSIDKVVTVSTPAIHGEPISAEKAEFLREVTPTVLASLAEVKE